MLNCFYISLINVIKIMAKCKVNNKILVYVILRTVITPVSIISYLVMAYPSY